MKPNLKMNKNKNKGSFDDEVDELIDSLADEATDRMPSGKKNGIKTLRADSNTDVKQQLKDGGALLRGAIRSGMRINDITLNLVSTGARPLLRPLGRIKDKLLGD